MALLKISEPGQSPEPHASKMAIGIDLGTTNSLVATVRNGQPEPLADEAGNTLMPSVVRYTKDEIITGDQAKKNAGKDPLNTLISMKRLIGRGLKELQTAKKQFAYNFTEIESKVPQIQTAGGNKTPIQVSADILSALAARAQNALGRKPEGVVVTVPAYFDDAQRQATKDAARLAGLHVLRLLNEPTAAAVAYGLDKHNDELIAVYDLGGGTFDISILRLSKGVFEVLATGGDSALGGDDFDHAIMEWMLAEIGIDQELSPQQERQLLTLACDLKEQLSDRNLAQVDYQGKTLALNRNQLHQIIDPLIDRSLLACKRCLRDAGLSRSAITNVVMVGGCTRSPRVREKVAKLFNRDPLATIDPDHVVAIGAAIQADILIGNKSNNNVLLLDVVPLSLGIETMGGLVEKIIHRNTTVPVTKAQKFTTFKDGQTAMSIHVLQGERELVSDNRSLAHFELRGIPPMVAGAAHVTVTFQVDADGLLSVSAREETTGVMAEVTVKPSYGLTDEEITKMLQNSLVHAQDDVDTRALREQQVEAERLIEALSVALAEDGRKLLSTEEYQDLSEALDQLKQVRNSGDADQIRQQVEHLSQLSDSFAARRMDSNIKRALSGHHLSEFETKFSESKL